MSDPIQFSRISALSRMSICPGSTSLIQELGLPSINNDATECGTAYHEYMEGYAPINNPDLQAGCAKQLAREYQCDEEYLLQIIQGSDFESRKDFDSGAKEVEVRLEIPAGEGCPEIHVPGHVDWMIFNGNQTEVWDYKSSRHPEHSIAIERDAQLMGYAVAARGSLTSAFDSPNVLVGKYYPVKGVNGYEWLHLNQEALLKAEQWLTFIVRRAWRMTQLPHRERTYRVSNFDFSTGCKGCDAVSVCDAWRHEIAKSRAMIGVDPKELGEIDSPETCLKLFEHRKNYAAGKRPSDQLGKDIVDYIDENGPVKVDSERELVVVEQTRGDKLVRFAQVKRKQEETV